MNLRFSQQVWRITTQVTLLLLLPTLFLTSCNPFLSFKSNGERVYLTATSDSGQAITYTGSIRMMHAISCANCHGKDGRGGRVQMMMWSFDTPDIRWDVLTQQEELQDTTGEHHDEHPPYTEATLKRAITEGLDPAGEPLDEEMPRWNMSESDLNDLVEFLKTLE